MKEGNALRIHRRKTRRNQGSAESRVSEESEREIRVREEGIRYSSLSHFTLALIHNATSYSCDVGMQYQFTTMFNINFFYNDVFAGKNYSDWTSFTLSVRGVF